VIRSSRFEDAIEKLTEAGADVIRPVVCEFSQRGEAVSASRMERWRRIVIEASEQCGRLYLPEVLPPAPLGRTLQAFKGALVVAAGDGQPAASIAPLLPSSGHVALVVGPEGGLSPAEEQALSRRGALRLNLGPNVLRTETAAVVGTAVLRALTTRA
jgi:16S rRNA (uracil1498-N3)-methyltransferase